MRVSIVGRIAAAGALAISAAACTSDAPAGEDGRPSVVATTTQVGSIVEELGGDAIELTVLLSPGVEAHDFELTPAQGAALEGADLILISGAGLEEWLERAIESAGADARVQDLSEGVELREPAQGEPVHDEDGQHDDEDEHEVDPHYWMAAPNAIVMVQNARDALVQIAPGAADGIEQRAATLVERLEAADAEVRRLIGEIPEEQRKLVTDHDAIGYFVDEYGLEFVGSVFPSLDVSSEPSARDVEALVAEIRGTGVAAIFTESSVNPRLARAIANESGARLVTEPLYTDSLGEEGSGAETLDGMLVHNATVIRGGLLGD